MVKQFCDKCGAEISKEELIGQFTYVEKTFSLSNDSTVPNPPKISQVNTLLCEKCCNKVKKHLK